MRTTILVRAVPAFACLAGFGCGNSYGFHEAKYANAPAREANCALTVSRDRPKGAAPTATGWIMPASSDVEIVGQILTGADIGTDAFDPKLMEKLKPSACEMGGEGIALLSEYKEHRFDSISFTYAVVRARVKAAP